MSFFSPDLKRQRALEIAEAVAALEDTDGWKHFVQLAEDLIKTHTPNISQFDEREACRHASQLVFISGIQRCLGLMEQQKNVLKAKKPL